jgi:hypothetical protein
MMKPIPSSVERCPFCHQTIRATTETCPHCGAERQFGPTRRESLTTVGVGVVAGPAGMLLIGGGTTLALMAAAICGVLGFFVVHSRHADNRWMPPKGNR